MNGTTVTMSVERYNELLRKEVIFEIEREELLRNKYRCDIDCFMYNVPTRAEEIELCTLTGVNEEDF